MDYVLELCLAQLLLFWGNFTKKKKKRHYILIPLKKKIEEIVVNPM